MKVTPLDLPGLLLVEPQVHADPRGFFLESYSHARYAQHGIAVRFQQDNHSRSGRGVLRGLHYQLSPGQCKLVRAVVGEIYDVAVDIRRGSPTFGQWRGCRLSADNKLQLFVPAGFAHGFCVLSEVAEVEYKVDQYYDPQRERGISYADPALGIAWPIGAPTVSPRDAALPLLAAAEIDCVYSG